MASLRFNRIPLIFVFDAPESVLGKFGSVLTGVALGGTGSFAYWGMIKTVQSMFPGAGPDVGTTPFGNKIIIPMLVNPTSISVQKNPRVSSTLTKRGILNQYWQSEPDLVSIAGRAAGDRAFYILSQLHSLMETMEEGTRNEVQMIYKFGGVYKGYFLNFRTAGDAMQPGVFDYSFDFQFADRRHFQLFYYALKASTLNEAVTQPGKFVTETLKIGAGALSRTSGISMGSFGKL